ncbi:MAG: Yip1 family protein [Novosphingobium sp.]
MTDVTNGGGSPLIDRAKNILLKPQEEWPKVAAEASSVQDILLRYVLPLAAIGPVASLIGSQLFGMGGFGITIRPSLMSALMTAILTYLMSVAGVFALSLIADFLAPRFGGQSHRLNAFKLAAYSGTAAFLAGAFGIIPSLGFLLLLSFYGVYLLYAGAAPLMKVPEDKAAGYVAVTVVGALIALVIIGAVGRTVIGAVMPGPTYMSESTVSGTATIPGVGTIDLGKAQQAANEIEAASRKPALDPAKLQSLLPSAIGGYQRTAVEATALGGMGSEANGTYAAGDKSFRLKITDMPAVGAIAGIGSAVGVAQSREDAEGYERTGTVNGRMQSEKWRKSGSGSFMIVIGNRFTVEAEGSAASIDELKAAVASVNEGTLVGLAS